MKSWRPKKVKRKYLYSEASETAVVAVSWHLLQIKSDKLHVEVLSSLEGLPHVWFGLIPYLLVHSNKFLQGVVQELVMV